MASVEKDYECNKCKHIEVTGTKTVSKCSNCGSTDLYKTTNRLE
jgi:DNA-directed RNA polymerase subunit RPC12/RpoP